MSHFGSALDDALNQLKWKQLDLAAKCGMPGSQVSRYIRGHITDITSETAAKIIAAFPPEHHAKVLVAYLRDCVPDGYQQLVEIYGTALSQLVAEAPPATLLLPTIDSELDKILRAYADLAMRHPEVRAMLRSFLLALRVLPPPPASVE